MGARGGREGGRGGGGGGGGGRVPRVSEALSMAEGAKKERESAQRTPARPGNRAQRASRASLARPSAPAPPPPASSSLPPRRRPSPCRLPRPLFLFAGGRRRCWVGTSGRARACAWWTRGAGWRRTARAEARGGRGRCEGEVKGESARCSCERRRRPGARATASVQESARGGQDGPRSRTVPSPQSCGGRSGSALPARSRRRRVSTPSQRGTP